MDNKEALNTARRHHHAGQLAEAEKIYQQVLQAEPNNPEALYLMGTVAGQRGDREMAINLVRRSIQARGDVAEAHRNLGVLLAQSKRYEDARVSFSKAAELRPDDAYTHLHLGNIHTLLNRGDDAIASFRRAVSLNPDLVAAYVGLGDALGAKGQYDEALSAYSRAARSSPNAPEIHNSMGRALFKKGRLDEAILAHTRATQLKPDFALAYFGLGHAHRASGDRGLEEALAAYRQAVKFKPDLFEAYRSMALMLADVMRFNEALECYGRAAELNPNSALTHEAMGAILLRQNGATAAVEHFRRAVAIDPDLFSSWNFLGLALQSLGKFEEAEECFKQMLTLRPDSVLAHVQLVTSSRKQGSEKEIEPILKLLRQTDLTTEKRINAEFAVATALDDAERYDEAFSHFTAANSLARDFRMLSGERYDPDTFHAMVDRIIQRFQPAFYEKRQVDAPTSELPVFVVGMPRSGTTLVHQIAASHPQVYGAGELNHIDRIVASMDDGSASGAEALAATAQRHLERLQSLDTNAMRVVDKMPSNLHHLGVIALLFPSARVVFCRREPRDNCLSCYFQAFTHGNAFSFNLAHCGHYYLENDRLRAHWLRTLPLKMLEVQYEDVVADLEGQSRKLIDFLGLPWDPACLEFYRTQATVLSSSIWQVRQPIYQKSVGRWRHYERHLNPLFESLAR